MTPRYFHGWGFNQGWQTWAGTSSTSGVTPNSAHWRIRPNSGTSTGAFGVIYDVEGSGSRHHSTQGMRADTEWIAKVKVGAPDYNSGNAVFKVCMYMRDDSDWWQTTLWKADEACSGWTSVSPGQNWTPRSTPLYELPASAGDDRYLRSYVVMQANGNYLWISDWEVERIVGP